MRDPRRLAALRATGLPDSPPEPAFDRLTRLAARLLGTSVAAVSLVDERRQFFKSAIGLPEPWASRRETPLSHAFCRHVVDRQRPLVVDDARAHPLVRDNLAVPELGVCAYLGVPLRTSDGYVLGALCVVDGSARAWREEDVRLMGELAESVMTEIELRGALVKARRDGAELARKTAELEAVFATMSDAVLVTDERGEVVRKNAAAEQLFAPRVGDILGSGMAETYGLYREDKVTLLADHEVPALRALAGERVARFHVFTRNRAAPEGRWHSVSAVPLPGEGGPRGVVLVGRDITPQKEAEEALRERKARLRLLADAAFEGIAVSAEGKLIDGNEAFAAMFGYEREGLIGMDATAFVAPAERERVARAHREGALGVYETVGLRKDGTTFPLEARGRMAPWGGRLVRITAVRDLTERKLAEAALARQTAFVGLLREAAAEANAAPSVEAALEACVGRVCRHMGWPVGHAYLTVAGASGPELAPSDVWHLADRERFRVFRDASRRGRMSAGIGLPGRVLADGRAKWLADALEDPAFLRRDAARASGLRSGFAFPVLVGREVAAVLEFYSERVEEPDGRLLEVMADVGLQLGRVVERERTRTAIERRAAAEHEASLTDELTGLRNRRGFLELASPLLERADRAGRPALLFFADINGMKRINDELGHDAGDEAIRLLARLLRATFREGDVLARLGGDEFVVFAPDAGPERDEAIRRRIRTMVDAHNAASGGLPFRLSVSLGAAAYDPRRPRGLEALLGEADELMYEQKRLRKPTGMSVPPPVQGSAPAVSPAGLLRGPRAARQPRRY